MTDQADETIRCPACQALNPASKRFCGDCGAPLDSQRTGIEEHLRLHLPARVAAILEERFKDQKLVELETSELIADRAVRWAKLVGFFLGIPIVAFAALLSFLGIQTYGDFTEAIQATQALESQLSEAQRRLSSTQGELVTAQQQAQAQLTEAQEELARAREQVASAELQAQQITDSVEEVQRTIETRTQNLLTTVAAFEEDIAEARARLAEIPELRQRQESLEADFRALRERIGFEQSAALPAELQARLEELFTRYFRYLDDAGFPQEPGLVTVTVDPNLQSNAYYNSRDRTVVIGGNIADDLEVPLREYTHHLLLTAHPGGGSIETALSVESALADYFPASFTDDPHIGEVFARTVELGQPYIRSLDNARRFEEIEPSSGMHDAGEVWGGAFWQIRETIGQRAADRLFARAWLTFAPSQGSQNLSAEFIAHLLDTARALQEIEDVEPVRAIFERRGFPISGG